MMRIALAGMRKNAPPLINKIVDSIGIRCAESHECGAAIGRSAVRALAHLTESLGIHKSVVW
jgi:hypothetical protein